MGCGTTFEQKELERIFVDLAVQKQKIPEKQLRKKRVIVLAGPTGCGKSALGMMLAEAIKGEIISADSMQVYRGMDIGTAKPTKAEQERIPHHLIDIRNVVESFNVVDFYYEARRACQVAHERGTVPIVVGGSGFYLHALIYGPPEGPPSILETRKALEEEMEKKGAQEMYERLKYLDPEYAQTITTRDKHKIVRALEILQLTGKKVSQLSWKSRKKPLNYDFHCWFLTRPRENLYHRIEKRCDKMLLEGLIEEVEELEKQGLRQNSSAAQAIGYRQSLDFLGGKRTRDDYRRFVDRFKQASRNYAKRQMTWFKRELFFRTLDLDLHDPETAMEMIAQDYESSAWGSA